MIMKPSFFLLIFLLSVVNLQAQYSLSISITTKKEQGEILMGLFNGPDQYLEEGALMRHCHKQIEGNIIICKWDDLPAGKCSAAVLIDENGNKKMDFSWIGWPKEAYGFYPDPGFLMRKPKWKECNFELKEDLEVELILRNQ